MGEVCDDRCNESGREECLSLGFGRGKPMSKNNAHENLQHWLGREKNKINYRGETNENSDGVGDDGRK